MKVRKLRVQEVAKGVGVTDVHIYLLLNKKRRPSRELRLAFQTYTGGDVSEGDWGPYPRGIGPKSPVFPYERTSNS